MIKGIVFPEQYVPAAGHGAIFNRMLSDGILAGCAMSYSGNIFNISKGYFIVGGRELEVEGTESIEITQNAGYARIKAVIDNSKVATEEEFEQHETVIEYAATVTDFSALQKEDLNMSETAIYEAEIAILSLGTEGITGVVRAMDYASVTKSAVITLPAASWADNAQTVNVAAVSADNTVFVSPAPNAENYAAYTENAVRCSAQAAGSLTFVCESAPSVDVTVNVTVINK